MSDVALNIAIKATNQANAAFAQVAAAQNKIKLAADQAKVAYDSYVQVMAKAKSTQSQVQVSADQVAVALDRVKIAELGATSATDRAKAAQQQAAQIAKEYYQALAEASARETALSRASTALGNVVTGLQEKFSGLRDRLGETHVSLLNFTSQLSMTFYGLQALVQGAMQFGQSLIAPNAQMEQATVALKTLLPVGNQAQQMMANLWQFAAKTPFQFAPIDAAAQKLIAFGVSAKNVIPDLTAIGDALSALGRTTPAALQGVVSIFGKIQTQGRLMTRDMMMLSNYGINAWSMLEKQLHLTHAQLQTMITKGLIPANVAIQALQKGMEASFGGGMAKQALTFTGLFTTVKDNIELALRSFTGPIFNAAKRALMDMADLVASPKFQNFATMLGHAIAPAMQQVALNVGHIINGIQQWLGQKSNLDALKNTIAGISGFFGALWGAIQTIVAGIPGAVGTYNQWLKALGLTKTGTDNTKTSLEELGSTIKNIEPVIGALAAIFVAAVHYMGDALNWLASVWNSIAKVVPGMPTIVQQYGTSNVDVGGHPTQKTGFGSTASPGTGSSGGPGTSGSGDISGLGTGTGTGKGGKKAQLFTSADINDILANAKQMGLKFNKAMFEAMSQTQRIKYLDQLVGDSHKKLAELLKKTHKGLADYVLWYIENAKRGKGGLILDNGVSGSVVTNPVSASKYSANFLVVNNIQILTNAKDGHDLYNWLLTRLERDLRRAGQLASMQSGGKAA